ncbi:PAS domain S-box protein [Candidatus Poribacteria bacterium]|nr:PAS domain S-box protein [Candidatus Poribacteria bacterium]
MSNNNTHKKITILNVDDEDAARYAVSRILRQAGFEVIEAANGAEVLRLVKKNPDLVILDVNLPDIIGFEVCRRIKADPATSSIPVLHLSATYQDSQSRVKGLEGGADGYLTHPTEPPVLISTVKALLRMRQAETEVLKAANRWNATFDAINDAIYLMDMEGRILQCNKAMTKLIGKSSDEIIGRACWELIHGTSEPIEGCPFVLMRETRKRETLVLPINDRWFNLAVDPLIGEDGNLIGSVHIISDITESKRMEEELQQSEEKYRNLVERANDGITIIQDEIVKYVNPRLAEMIGDTAEAIIDTPLTDYIHPDEFPKVFDRYKRRMAGEDVTPIYETILMRKDGSKAYVELNAGVITYQGRPADFVIVRDITERKQAEEEIRRNYDIQRVTNSLLRLSLEDIPLEELLNRAVDLILSIPWLAFESRGGIFLVEDEPNVLVMKAQNGLSEPIQKACRQVPFGRCLCGQAALAQEIQFANYLDARHQTRYEGITPHGHYCVPILSAGRTVGVINMYLREEHPRNEKEEQFLRAVADVLAGIIKRRQAEKALQVSEEEYRTLFEYTRDAIITIGSDGRLLSANPASAVMLGYESPEELVGMPATKLYMNPEERKVVLAEILEKGYIQSYEITFVKKDGMPVYVIATSVARRDEKGNIIRIESFLQGYY